MILFLVWIFFSIGNLFITKWVDEPWDPNPWWLYLMAATCGPLLCLVIYFVAVGAGIAEIVSKK